jgi:diacylglycerol kinase family enzyme
LKHGFSVAIAAGGDGVIGGVITHIAENGPPLGILPLGTSNDIARSLSIPQNLLWAAEAIAHGQERSVDIGVAQPAEQAPHSAGPPQQKPVSVQLAPQKHGYFAHTLTLGLNVQFARLATNVATRLRYGRLAYPLAAVEAWRNHAALKVHLHFEGLKLAPPATGEARSTPAPEELTTLSCPALEVAVINAPIFGGQWQLAIPGASLSDRLLDIVVIQDFEPGYLSARLAHLFGLQVPTLPDTQAKYFTHHPAELTGISGIHHVQAYGVTVTTQADPQDVTLDGEVRGQTPIHTHIADQPLRVVVPPS